MADADGATPRDPYYNLDDPRLHGGVPPSLPGDALRITIEDESDGEPEVVTYEQTADGNLKLKLNGGAERDKAGADEHDANLAEYLDERELYRIADELLNGIDADKRTRQDWLDRRAAGIKHLALKVENPRSPSADADTAVEGQSTIRSPIMLDAVLRFQANARGELLPAGGPAKMRNATMLTPPMLAGPLP